MNQFPPSLRVLNKDLFKFFRKFTEIFTSQGAPPVSTTGVNDTSSKIAAGINDIDSKFATGINDTGGKFFHHFLTNLPPVSTMGIMIKLLTT
jgi:hypothetical protein